MKKSVDKRTYKRIKTPSLSVDFKVKGNEAVYSVELLNLAAGGMCFLRKSVLQKDDILTVKFPFKSQKILLTGQVIRIEGREAAVKFLNSEDEIGRFVDAFNEEYPRLSRGASKKTELLTTAAGTDPSSRCEDPDSIFDLNRP